jgi:hypothetical protein
MRGQCAGSHHPLKPSLLAKPIWCGILWLHALRHHHTTQCAALVFSGGTGVVGGSIVICIAAAALAMTARI